MGNIDSALASQCSSQSGNVLLIALTSKIRIGSIIQISFSNKILQSIHYLKYELNQYGTLL